MNNFLVSVIIPTKNSAKTLEKCLRSVRNQTYKNIEIIVVVPKEDSGLKELSSKFNFTLLPYLGGKSASRNVGSGIARGEFLLHLDDDMMLESEVVSECVRLATGDNLRAIAIPEVEEKSSGLYNEARILEKIIASSDKHIEAPRFIEKNTYQNLGGVDVRLDPIDEGDLKAKLEEGGFKHATTVSRITLSSENRMSSFGDRWSHVYRRGQKTPLFNFLHPSSVQFKPSKRVSSYFKGAHLLASKNFVGILLVMIKTIDLVVLKIGSLRVSVTDKKIIADLKNKKIFENEAGTYQREFFENTLGARHVDKKEKGIVKQYLKDINKESQFRILDIGSGGGRWSRLMLESFPRAEVSACDLSDGMVADLKNKFKTETRFRAVVGDMQQLPFKEAEFDLAISIRAVKYAQDQAKVFKEIYRVLKPGSYAIIELPYLNIIYRLVKLLKVFGKLSAYANRIKLMRRDEIIRNAEAANLKILAAGIYFTVPATIYKKINNAFILGTVNIINCVLPKRMFGRSLFLMLYK